MYSTCIDNKVFLFPPEAYASSEVLMDCRFVRAFYDAIHLLNVWLFHTYEIIILS